MAGCSNHGCFISPPKGMGTNGICHCLDPLGRENSLILRTKITAKNHAIAEAIKVFKDYEMNVDDYPKPKHHKNFMAMLEDALSR